MNKYKVKMDEMQEMQQGGANLGKKLIAFNASDFPELDSIDKDKFWQTKKIAEKIKDKAFIVELDKNIADVFGSTQDDIKRMASKTAFISVITPFKAMIKSQFKEDIVVKINALIDDSKNLKDIQPIVLSKPLTIVNHAEIFNEIKEKSPVPIDKYILVDFKFGDNKRIL